MHTISKHFTVYNIAFGYLQRSFPGVRSRTDAEEAFLAGAAAVRAALESGVTKGTIGILREEVRAYRVAYAARPIADAAKETRSLPREFIAKNGHDVTQAFIDYARPLVGDLPPCAVI